MSPSAVPDSEFLEQMRRVVASNPTIVFQPRALPETALRFGDEAQVLTTSDGLARWAAPDVTQAELDALAATVAAIPVVMSGTAIVDFGSFPGASDASVAVTGQTSIAATSEVDASLVAVASDDHSADEHWVEEIVVTAGNIVPGTGFTIYARSSGSGDVLLSGKWNVVWKWV